MPKQPIVFVPGLGGSFNLLVLLDWSAPTLSGWDFPPFISYGRAFADTCVRAGYTRNRDLFVAFYDWRKSVVDSANNYLIPWIDRAKKLSGSDKVVLVAHSMGGLVSRSYIQSSAYRGDVERLITLGTPHQGSSDSYYPWQAGEIQWGPVADSVFNVYLWYLEHAHPFQTGLNRLRTVRTQAPGVRDLLPVFDYLQRKGAPGLTPCARLQQRNLVGELLCGPAGAAQLLGRVSLTTINGKGFATVQSLVVDAPPAATDDPPHYVDGRPVEKQTTGEGDGTVLLSSAVLADPRVRNLPPQPIVHDELPDKAVAQVLAELGVAAPAPATVPVPATQLVIMSASPLELSVELPAQAPTRRVLSDGAPAPARPGRRIRAKNYGHAGKRLNMLIIPEPAASSYQVRLRGTETGTFALGALLVGQLRPAVLSESAEDGRATASAISTAHGQVAAETELIYHVDYRAPGAAPEVRFDADATAQNLLDRLGAVARTPQPRVLAEAGETATAAAPRVLAEADATDELRELVAAALLRGDAAAAQQLVARLRSADPQAIELIVQLAEQVVGSQSRQLALGLLEQLRQIATSV